MKEIVAAGGQPNLDRLMKLRAFPEEHGPIAAGNYREGGGWTFEMVSGHLEKEHGKWRWKLAEQK